jgi:hypothetical protein
MSELKKGWVRLYNLRDGAIFENKDGIRAVKSEYSYSNENLQPQCILLASGEFAHFPDKENTWVREIDLAEPPSQPEQRDAGDVYSEGISGDGAAILCNGIPMKISEIVDELNRKPPFHSLTSFYEALSQNRTLFAEIIDIAQNAGIAEGDRLQRIIARVDGKREPPSMLRRVDQTAQLLYSCEQALAEHERGEAEPVAPIAGFPAIKQNQTLTDVPGTPTERPEPRAAVPAGWKILTKAEGYWLTHKNGDELFISRLGTGHEIIIKRFLADLIDTVRAAAPSPDSAGAVPDLLPVIMRHCSERFSMDECRELQRGILRHLGLTLWPDDVGSGQQCTRCGSPHDGTFNVLNPLELICHSCMVLE